MAWKRESLWCAWVSPVWKQLHELLCPESSWKSPCWAAADWGGYLRKKTHHVTFCKYTTVTGYTFWLNTLTLIELKAEVGRSSRTGVVDRFFVEVISGKHISPKLNKQLYKIYVLCFSCMMKSRLMELGSVHICPFGKKRSITNISILSDALLFLIYQL